MRIAASFSLLSVTVCVTLGLANADTTLGPTLPATQAATAMGAPPETKQSADAGAPVALKATVHHRHRAHHPSYGVNGRIDEHSSNRPIVERFVPVSRPGTKLHARAVLTAQSSNTGASHSDIALHCYRPTSPPDTSFRVVSAVPDRESALADVNPVTAAKECQQMAQFDAESLPSAARAIAVPPFRARRYRLAKDPAARVWQI